MKSGFFSPLVMGIILRYFFLVQNILWGMDIAVMLETDIFLLSVLPSWINILTVTHQTLVAAQAVPWVRVETITAILFTSNRCLPLVMSAKISLTLFIIRDAMMMASCLYNVLAFVFVKIVWKSENNICHILNG